MQHGTRPAIMKKLLLLAFMAVASKTMAQDAQCVREGTAMIETIRAHARWDTGALPSGISESVLEAVAQPFTRSRN